MNRLLIITSLLTVLYSCQNISNRSNSKPQEFTNEKNVLQSGFSNERLARVDSFLQNAIREGILPNCVTFVVRNGAIIHNKAYGWKNIEKNEILSKDDIYRNASQTKAIVSVGLMMLYEQGKFLLDDPVSMYIPAFKNMQVLDSLCLKDTSFVTHTARKEITVRQLLNHTSGLTYWTPYYIKYNIPQVNSIKDETIKDVVTRLAELPLKHEPGEAFTYGLSMDVAGYLIEVLSGLKLDVYLDSFIFKPIGMKDTYFYLPENKVNRLVTLYEKEKRRSQLKLTRNKQNEIYPVEGAKKYLSGGAGLVGTIEDYAKFCQMMLNGGEFNHTRLLSPKTVKLMTMNQIGDLVINKEGDKFGLGFQIFTRQGGYSRFLSSLGAYRWGGMYCTDYVIDPTENLICLFYTNVEPFGQHSEILEKFRVLVYQSLID